jgi:mannan endo-1,4-beta-mannosidase
VAIHGAPLTAFACADARQAIVYLLRTDTVARDGTLRRDAAPISPTVHVPGLVAGRYRVTRWSTTLGAADAVWDATQPGDTALSLPTGPLVSDAAFAIRRAE